MNFPLSIKPTSFNVWARYFVWNFKGTIWNSHKISDLFFFLSCILFSYHQCWWLMAFRYIYQSHECDAVLNYRSICVEITCRYLTHWGRLTHICVSKQTIIGSDNGHYLNQCWNIVNWTLRNNFQWNFNRNSNIFIQEIAFENVDSKMASTLSQPQ